MYKVIVGTPQPKYSRKGLEYSARELGFSDNFIEELSDSELLDRVLKEGCRQNEQED